MRNDLYKEFADYYAAVLERDFKGQMELLLGEFTAAHPCRNMLELFAGQSLHSISADEFAVLDNWAVDSSAEMKALAIGNGFKRAEQYLVGNLPEALSPLKHKMRFDCIFALFNGVCNLEVKALYELLSQMKILLNTYGKIFLEFHDLYYIMKYMEDPRIDYQEVKDKHGNLLKFAWPSDTIKWNSYSFTAEVPVRIMTDEQSIDFYSIDHLHSTELILFLAGLVGLQGRILTEEERWKATFPCMIVLELSHR